jgi:hypothetical protein
MLQTHQPSEKMFPNGQVTATACTGLELSDVEYVIPTPIVGCQRSDQLHAAEAHGVHDPTAMRPVALST